MTSTVSINERQVRLKHINWKRGGKKVKQFVGTSGVVTDKSLTHLNSVKAPW